MAATQERTRARALNASSDADNLRAFDRSLPMALLRAREAVMDQFRGHLRELGVTEQQWRILRALGTLGECNASEISNHTCVSMPSLSRILHGLESRALVERRSDRHDLRSVRIRISSRGTALLRKGAQRSELIYAEITAAFGKEQVEALYVLLEALTDSLTTE